MLHVDLAAREVSASVRDLAHAVDYVGSSDGALGAARALLGSEVHRDYRRQRARSVPGFTGEVAVSGTVHVDGFVARLRGRVDGIIAESGARLCVEEVKSVALTARALAELGPESLSEAALQLRLYALLLARTRKDARIRARLVLVSVLEDATRELDVTLRPARTEQALMRRLRQVIRAARQRAERARQAGAEVGRLRFPYPAARPHQHEMSAFVDGCLEAGNAALVEAPTGIGKTIAALLPALEYARRRGALLYVLTAKRTQRARVAATFEDLVAARDPPADALRALTLRPRAAMCPPATLLCHPQHCTLLANVNHKERREAALDELLGAGAHIEPQAVFEVGVRRALCPHMLSLLLCARVDVVIGDYNHVYGSSTPPGQFPGELLPRPVVVVIDEAHNLFDRAREYDSPFLARGDVTVLLAEFGSRADGRVAEEPLFAFARAGADTATLDARITRHLTDVLALIDRTLERAVLAGPAFPDGCRPVETDAAAWAPLAKRGAQLLLPYAQRLAARGLSAADDPLLRVLQAIGRIHELLGREDPALVPYAADGSDASRGRGLGICCVDPSARLAARHRDVVGTVAMSATLTPLSHYRAVLGFDAVDARSVAYGSPFPPEQRCIAVVPTVNTTWRARRHHYGRIARTIERTIAVKPGHYIAYFPSFAFLEAVRAKLRTRATGLLVQTSRMPDDARADVIARMVSDPAPLLLLAVAGGVFAEGVDLPGDALIGVVVVGPALPRVGFERAAMAHHFEQARGGGFACAMLLPGMQRVVQAAGRVHRTPDDKGVIVLLGRRFTQAPYADRLPRHWSRYGLEETITDDPVARLTAFWNDRLAT